MFFEDDELEEWRKWWKGMPEYSQEDLTPHRSLIVHFVSEGDFKQFQELVQQDIPKSIPSIWFPEQEKIAHSNKRWISKEK